MADKPFENLTICHGNRMMNSIQKPELKMSGIEMFPVFGCQIFESPL
jgi:hypothetical protein